jgi:hypothetical protein
MSMGWDYVSEAQTPMGLFLIPKMICKYGEPRTVPWLRRREAGGISATHDMADIEVVH